MSAVALPHVPSARAPSSAASSTRHSLHSAGSTASHVSSKSLRQSCDEEDEAQDEDEEDDEEDEEDDEEPHASSHGSGSGGLWDEVESFLNKPSPSFAALAKDTGKSSSAGANVLPTLQKGDRKQPVAPPGGGSNQAGPRGSRPAARMYAKQSSASIAATNKAIDPKLLQEAFAYAERIQRVNFDEEEDEQGSGEIDQQREADRRGVGMLRRDTSFGSSSGSGPRMPQDVALQKRGSLRGKADEKSKKKKSVATAKASAYGASVKPQVAKKKSVSSERRATTDGSGWDASPSSSADPSGDGMARSRKGSSASMDQQTIQSLVSSLQNGTTLDELRRELAASQQSLQMSRQVIQDAAKSFFRK